MRACPILPILLMGAVTLGCSDEPAVSPADSGPALQPDAGHIPADGGTVAPDAPAPTCDFEQLDATVSLTLLSVWGASVDDVWVGTEGFSLLAAAEVLHFENGVAKKISTGNADDVRAISGRSADDVWFAATLSDASHHTILHWDGAQLTTAHSAHASSASLQAIWARTPTDVWAVGHKQVLHLVGDTWSTPPATYGGMFDTFYGACVAGASASSVILGRASSSALCWDGTKVQSCVSPTPPLKHLVYTASGSYWGWNPNARAVVQSADGSSWQTIRTFAADEPQLVAIAARSDSDVWIATSRVAVPGGYEGPFVDRYDGATWHRNPLDTAASIKDIAVIDNSVWVVGTQGYVARCIVD
jgi:hypothetical protein